MNPHRLRVETFLLCRSLEVASNDFFILGGGWGAVWLSTFPATLPAFQIAVRLIVPFAHTNRELIFRVTLEDEDGHQILPHAMRPTLSVGKPVTLLRGEEQAVNMPLYFEHIAIPHPGTYTFRFLLGDEELARTAFTAFRST
jgi:hypothetical protein